MKDATLNRSYDFNKLMNATIVSSCRGYFVSSAQYGDINRILTPLGKVFVSDSRNRHRANTGKSSIFNQTLSLVFIIYLTIVSDNVVFGVFNGAGITNQRALQLLTRQHELVHRCI